MAGVAEPTVPFRLVVLDEVDSTNAEALRRASGGERGPIWIMARRQTRGRGRSGRAWQDAPGNLMATLLMAPGCPPAALHHLSFLAGIAVYDGAAGFLPGGAQNSPALRLKWPNDLLLDGAKLAGILVESSSFGGETLAAVGVGVNVASAPDVAGRSVAALAGQGPAGPRADELLCAIAAEFERRLRIWDQGAGFSAILAAWLERSGPIGEPITVHAGNGLAHGTFAGLAPDGALLVRDRDGHVTRVTAGDVSLGADTR